MIRGYLNYRLIKWLLALVLLITVPLLAACAGGTTTPPATTTTIPPETVTITPPPETITITLPPETGTITPTPTNQQPIEIVSVVGPLPPINPGGPVVEITLKNVSAEIIVSLTATLELQRVFTFAFNVTSYNPLIPTESISAKLYLIGPGGGFGDSISYPLTLEGTMQNGATFAYTKHVMIIHPLQIDSPEDKAELNVNIQKVSGVVSDPEAEVQVNGVDVGVNQDGTFYIYVELSEGENIIEAIAKRGDDTYSDSITVTFIPALAVYVTNLAFEPGVDYSKTPVTVTGWVSNDEATVSVNGNQAQVAEDGNFSVDIQLEEGANDVEAIATLDGKTDRWSWSYRIQPDGTFGPPHPGPQYQNAPSLDWPDDIQLKAGETKLLYFTMMTGKERFPNFSIPRRFHYELYGYPALSGSEKIPIPEGLEISLEPSSEFILFPNTTYNFTITITAAPDLPPIPYYIGFEISGWGPGLTINVEE